MWIVVLLAMAAGAGVGAAGLAGLTVAYHSLFFRTAFRDGQYSAVLLLQPCIGAVFGALTGFGYALGFLGATQLAAWVWTITGVAAGLLLAVGVLLLATDRHHPFRERVSTGMFWLALPLAWAAGLALLGVRLLVEA